MTSRRRFLAGTLGALALATEGASPIAWDRAACRKKPQSRVLIARATDYAHDLADLVAHGLRDYGVAVAGKNVVLKPNLVEFDPDGVINTHPAFIGAAIDAFRRLGARKVVVAEGPGHRRDNEYLLAASGLYDVLRERQVDYVDLNLDEVRPLATSSRFTRLGRLYLP